MICNTLAQNEVYASADSLRLFLVITGHKFTVIISIKEIPANRKFFQKLRVGGFADIGIAVILFIPTATNRNPSSMEAAHAIWV